jgi:HAD superfamily hydrolase (TIGR01509 family)
MDEDVGVRHSQGHVPDVFSDLDKDRIKALLFDLGGVVIDLDFERVFSHWARVAECTVGDLSSRFYQDEAYCQHERGELDVTGYFASLRTSLGIDLTDEEFLEGWNDLYLGVSDGIESLLRVAASAYPTFAFTNSNPSHQTVWASLFSHELGYFRAVFVSSELGFRKPDPRAFERVARDSGFEPRDFLFFDDSEEPCPRTVQIDRHI